MCVSSTVMLQQSFLKMNFDVFTSLLVFINIQCAIAILCFCMFEVAFNFDHHQQDPEEQDTEIIETIHIPSSTSNNELIQINDQTREDQAQKQLIDFKVVELKEDSEKANHDQNLEQQKSISESNTNIKQELFIQSSDTEEQLHDKIVRANDNEEKTLQYEQTSAMSKANVEEDKVLQCKETGTNLSQTSLNSQEKSSAFLNQKLDLNRSECKTRDYPSKTQDEPMITIKTTINSSESEQRLHKNLLSFQRMDKQNQFEIILSQNNRIKSKLQRLKKLTTQKSSRLH